MKLVRDGIPASPGIVVGPAYVLRWEIPRVPHVTVAGSAVEEEVARFHEALAKESDATIRDFFLILLYTGTRQLGRK